MPKNLQDLLSANKKWADGVVENTPDFFERLAEKQTPEFLWIGCADSRVPETTITNSMPGTIFVQRNIANTVIPSDLNLMSVVHYAVGALKVKHIIVCGHYGCGGIKAAMSNDSLGFLDSWLMHIKNVYHQHEAELNAITDQSARENRFIELNVMEQVKNLAKTPLIQETWSSGTPLQIHGCVYDLATGLLNDLGVSLKSNASLEKIYHYEQ